MQVRCAGVLEGGGCSICLPAQRKSASKAERPDLLVAAGQLLINCAPAVHLCQTHPRAGPARGDAAAPAGWLPAEEGPQLGHDASGPEGAEADVAAPVLQQRLEAHPTLARVGTC